MTEYEKKRLDVELKNFTLRNFEKPANCQNLAQVQFYMRELCEKIEDMEKQFHYVPHWAYTLLAQYNAAQNSMLYAEFRNTYC